MRRQFVFSWMKSRNLATTSQLLTLLLPIVGGVGNEIMIYVLSGTVVCSPLITDVPTDNKPVPSRSVFHRSTICPCQKRACSLGGYSLCFQSTRSPTFRLQFGFSLSQFEVTEKPPLESRQVSRTKSFSTS